MRLSTAVALALTLLLAVLTAGSAVVAPVTAAAPAADGSPASVQSLSTAPALESSVQDDEYAPERADPWQVIRLNVTETGDVRWTLESRFTLSPNETDEFGEYAEAVANGDRDVGYDVEQYERARADAAQSTGREMALENETWNVSWNESLDSEGGDGTNRKLGVISYSFTWTNFSEVNEQRIVFGDAFVTDDGVWLPYLEDGQRLVIESPSNYGFDTAPTGPSGGAITYDGYRSLAEEDFQIVFLRSTDSDPPSEPGTEPEPEPEPPSEPEPEPEPPDESESALTVERAAAAFGGFVLFIVAASLVISRYQRSAWPFDGESAAGADRPRATETDGSGTGAVASTADPSGIEHEFDETEAVDTDPDAETDAPIDDELLSDDERVQRLLERNGGRMKQATIVKETGWSDAKVSQLLSEMDDDDRIRKLRIGRENLITLPDVDPTEID